MQRALRGGEVDEHVEWAGGRHGDGKSTAANAGEFAGITAEKGAVRGFERGSNGQFRIERGKSNNAPAHATGSPGDGDFGRHKNSPQRHGEHNFKFFHFQDSMSLQIDSRSSLTLFGALANRAVCCPPVWYLIVASESLRVWPVRMQTMRSSL